MGKARDGLPGLKLNVFYYFVKFSSAVILSLIKSFRTAICSINLT